MTTLTPHQQAVAFIAAAFPVPSWEPETLRLYADELADLRPAVLQRTVRDWVRTRSERPTVADLRVAAKNMASRMQSELRRQLRAQRDPHALPGPFEPVDPEAARASLRELIDRLSRRRATLKEP